MAINAIETFHAGHRFRSRLEARWAVVFDSLDLRWEYEPQGYLVGERRRPYLPDFYLPDAGWWVEVKGDSERLDTSLLIDAVHPTLGLGRTDAQHMTSLLILGSVPRAEMPHGHWSIRRSAVIGTPRMAEPTPGTGCGGDCVFTRPMFGLHQFFHALDVPAALRDTAGEPEREEWRRRGALIVPACRSTSERPDIDMTRAIPMPSAFKAPYLTAAYILGRSARFEHGEAA